MQCINTSISFRESVKDDEMGSGQEYATRKAKMVVANLLGRLGLVAEGKGGKGRRDLVVFD